MPDNDLIRLNITIKPPAEAASRAIEYSRALARRYEAEFVLDGINFFPHITLYSPVFPEKNLDQIIETVGAWSGGLGKVDCIFHKAADENGFVILECVPIPELTGLHNSAVNSLNPLREGRHKAKYDTPEYQAGLSDEQKYNIAAYGYANIMNL